MQRSRSFVLALAAILLCALASLRPAHTAEPTAREIADLIDELRDPDPHVRQVAHKELVRLGGEPVPALVAAVRGSDAKLSSEALAVLADIGPEAKAAAPDLAEFAATADAAVCIEVVRALAEIDAPAVRPLVDRLVRIVDDGQPSQQIEALRVLAWLGPAAESAKDPLVARLTKAPPALRQPLVETLQALGFDGVGHVLDLWTADRQSVQSWAPQLFVANSEAAVEAAAERLRRPEKEARVGAATALGAMGPAAAEAAPNLAFALKDDTGAVRRAAADALGRIGAAADVALPALVEALSDPRLRVQREAAAAIGNIAVAASRTSGAAERPRAPAELAVANGLDWLARHQAKDGRWDADGFTSACDGARCEGAGNAGYDPGVTGLALLCFLRAGETPQRGGHSDAVGRGLAYLQRIQERDGCFGPREPDHFIYNHACAALAVTEAYAATGDRALEESAQRAVDFVLKARNPDLAWRYVRDGENDTSVTAWAVSLLDAAAKAGLPIDEAALTGAVAWVDQMTAPNGRTGYIERGGKPARTNEMLPRFPPEMSESMTASGLLVRLLAGRKGHPAVSKGASLLARRLPKWDESAGTIDLYYWMQGTTAMRLIGGGHWATWRRAVVAALVEPQEAGPACAGGSWRPVDPWSPDGGRVYATAAALLCLEPCVPRPTVRVSMPEVLRSAVAALTAALQTDDAEVRKAAETALDQIRAAYR